ncbi:MAG: hypothetical protein KatS3mg032_1617 [Cyclobacteriaceae bacterium]|nr:MAG: hypothetical protein KatS3mg032_1617 [Cyclobacteriaceae bacterium]
MKPARLKEIWIYPVKSLGGYRCAEALALEKGFVHDRRWMLIDANNRFLTQREHPEMALFSVFLSGNTLKITHRKTAASVQFEVWRQSGKKYTARIWQDEVTVYEVHSEVSRWFTHELGLECRLVRFPEENPRPAYPRYVPLPGNVSLADAYPYLIIGQASLDLLNRHLINPVSMLRFRPNLVISGSEPFAEDAWKKFTIGQVLFEAVKPCARCILTTVDPDTGIRGKEPLKTLAAFRKTGNAIYFGMNAIAHTSGIISENDEISFTH